MSFCADVMSMTSNASFIVLICILLSSGYTFAELDISRLLLWCCVKKLALGVWRYKNYLDDGSTCDCISEDLHECGG